MPGRLEGKIALISGSTQGFGRGILETFIHEGAMVLGMDLQAVDGPVPGYPEHRAYQIQANVADEQSWKKAVMPLASNGHRSPFANQRSLPRYSSRHPRHGSGRPRQLSFTMPDGRTPTSRVLR